MASRIPSNTLYKIQTDHLQIALERYSDGTTPPRFVDSTRFDLLHSGRRYPPKAVIALAAEAALGRTLTPDEFSGGEGSTAFRVLLERGFEVVTKSASVGTLDATFSVGRNSETEFLIFESKGPNRNVDYMAGLESVLLCLANLDVVVTDANVDSLTSRELSPANNRLELEGYNYPLSLRHVSDINALRRSITRAAASTARATDSRGGGNPTKRLRFDLQNPSEPTLFELQQAISEQGPFRASRSTSFAFKPSKPTQLAASSERGEMESTTVAYVHAGMQRALYASLVDAHGESAVAAECRMTSGNPADLVVKTPEGLEIYEIKTSLAPRECVRQAIGQLLEYGHWPVSDPIAALCVVGPREIDEVTNEYIDILKRTYHLPLRYLCQPEDRSRRT